MTAQPSRAPDYGHDAPGVMAGLLGVGAGLRLATARAVRAEALPSPFRLLAGLVVLALGLAMWPPALAGKRRVRRPMLDLVPWRGDEAVLDVGTGRGFLAVGAAARLRMGHVTGIDIWNPQDLSGNGPNGARAKAVAVGVADRVTIRDRDARDLGLPDASMHVVLSLLCLHNIPGRAGRARACAEIARVLRPGGTVMLGGDVPTTGCAAALAARRLQAVSTRPAFGVAPSLMWITHARKPRLP